MNWRVGLKPCYSISKIVIGCAAGCLGLFLAASNPGYAAGTSSGLGEAVDGHTVILNGQRFRLFGIVAPKPGFQCKIRGSLRDCGNIARAALLDLMAGSQITCLSASGGRYRCTANGYDLSEGMVYVGWAVPLADAPTKYQSELKRAQDRQHGLWRASPALTIKSILAAGR